MKIFISRNLSTDSVFKKSLTEKGHKVFGLSLIEFSALPFDLPDEMDWLFFYSQNGARFFFDAALERDLTKVKIGAIGPATAEVVESYDHAVHFVGDGNSKTTSEAFLHLAAGQKVVFPRAETSRRSTQKILGDKIESIDLVVYRNVPKERVELDDFDLLVFTSPLNAQAYFSMKKWQESQRVIAIGETTAGALKKLGIEKVEVAGEPSERGLVSQVEKSS